MSIFSNAINCILNNHFLVTLKKLLPEKKFMIFMVCRLICQSNEPGGFYFFDTIDVEGRRITLGYGGGSFKQCVSYTNQTIFECQFGEIWKFKLSLLNPIHNQTIDCSRILTYNRTSLIISTTIFVQGNYTWVIETNRNYY